MIKHLTHSEIDKTRWDLCIAQSENSLIYAYSWFLDIVAPGWEALVQDDYDAVFPLTHRKKFFAYLFTPFFTQQLGLFFKPDCQTNLNTFLEALPVKFRYIDIQLNEMNLPDESKWKFRKRRNYVLNLNKTHEKLVKGYQDSTRRSLKKAAAAMLYLHSLEPDEAVDFYIKHKGRETLGLKSSDYDRFRELLKTASSKRSLLCKGVFHRDGTLLASAILLTTTGRITLINNCASGSGRELRAMHYLIDQLIMQFAGQSLVFDFEGSDLEGVARFYKSFGAEKKWYYRLRINRLPWYARWMKN